MDESRKNGHLVQLIDVVKSFPVGDGEVTVLKGLDFNVNNGEFVSIVGPSGNGKSTLLNMITGIDRPSGGEVIVTGREIHNLSENKLAAWRGQHVGIVFKSMEKQPSLEFQHIKTAISQLSQKQTVNSHGSYCPSCGISLTEGNHFCPECGNTISV